jgi:hypothetical protein
MPLAALNLPAGVVKPATPLQVKGRYWDANLVRWRSGKLLPVGGWQRISSSPLSSTCRTIFAWSSVAGLPYGALGCEENLYILDGSSYADVTPDDYVSPDFDQYGSYGAFDYGELLYGLDYGLVAITTAVRSSNVVTITTAEAHSFPVGMSVLIAGVADATFNGTFTIASVPSSTTFTYAQTASNASSTGGTAALPVADRRPQNMLFTKSFSWTFDNWGEDLLAVSSSDGRLLHWNVTETKARPVGTSVITTIVRSSNVATVTTEDNHGYAVSESVVISGNAVGSFNGTQTIASVPSAKTFTFSSSGTDTTGAGGSVTTSKTIPINNRAVIVTPERHAVLLGAGGVPRRVAWSSRENYTDWDFASTSNTAGYLDLDTESLLVMCAPVREGTLIWTESEAWLMRFIGLPYVYSIERIGFGCGLMSPRSFATTAGRCIWMGKESFWMYDGGVVKPLACDVGAYVFDNIDPNSGPLYAHGSDNGVFPEVWFWFPSQGSSVPDLSVFFNFQENWWGIGNTMTRTAACSAGVFNFPLATDDLNEVYYQEAGWTAAGTPIEEDRYAETGSLNLQNGNAISFVRQALTDSGYGYDSTQLTFFSSFTPEGAETTSGPYNPRSDGYTDVRVTGRDFRIKVAATQDAEWSIGQMRIDFVPKGGR